MTTFRPTPDASRRTKNRLTEHRDLTPGQSRTISSFPGPATLFRCEDDDCDWFGWLPSDELVEVSP
jgi:hypothetical protein